MTLDELTAPFTEAETKEFLAENPSPRWRAAASMQRVRVARALEVYPWLPVDPKTGEIMATNEETLLDEVRHGFAVSLAWTDAFGSDAIGFDLTAAPDWLTYAGNLLKWWAEEGDAEKANACAVLLGIKLPEKSVPAAELPKWRSQEEPTRTSVQAGLLKDLEELTYAYYDDDCHPETQKLWDRIEAATAVLRAAAAQE